MDTQRQWHDISKEPQNDEADAFVLGTPLMQMYANSRTTFEVTFETMNCMSRWDGICGIKLHYKRGGDGDRRDVNAKAFARASQSRRPLTFYFRHLQWTKRVVDKESERSHA